MGKRVVDDASLSGVAEAIRAKTGKVDQLVFPGGFSVGVDEAYKAGKRKEWSDFWDLIQSHGQKRNYDYCFYSYEWDDYANIAWNNRTFMPKYDIYPTSAQLMLHAIDIENLSEHIQTLGIKLDLSRATTVRYLLNRTTAKKVPVMDFSGVTASDGLDRVFSYSQIEEIEKMVVPKKDVQFNNTFLQATELKTITFEGTIQRSFSMEWQTKLSKASITSVINALSSTASGQSVTFSRSAINNAFTTAEWSALAGTKSNWTINLI